MESVEVVERPELELYKNSNYINIFKCCMSCANKCIDSQGRRSCKLNQSKIDKYHVCDEWVISEGFANAGIGGGKVDMKCYDKFVEKRANMTDMEAYLHGFSMYCPDEEVEQ